MLLSVRDRETPAGVLRQAVSTAVLAERLGFDGLWISEHHGTPLNVCPDPLTMLAAIGESVPRLRVGTAIVNLPLHHPLGVAERVSMVDNLTGGRLELGIGRGFATAFRDRSIPSMGDFPQATTRSSRRWLPGRSDAALSSLCRRSGCLRR